MHNCGKILYSYLLLLTNSFLLVVPNTFIFSQFPNLDEFWHQLVLPNSHSFSPFHQVPQLRQVTSSTSLFIIFLIPIAHICNPFPTDSNFFITPPLLIAHILFISSSQEIFMVHQASNLKPSLLLVIPSNLV